MSVRVITVPAPADFVPDERMLVGWPEASIWRGRDGAVAVALGVAARVQVSGADHVARTRRAIDELWSRVEVAESCAGAPRPKLFGGVAFTADWHDEPWRDFSDGDFILPRWTFHHDGERGFVTVAQPETRAEIFERPIRERAGVVDPGMTREAWIAHVERIRGEIRGGAFEKIVAARRVIVDGCELDGPAIAARLARAEEGTFRFLFARGGAAFVGASPERLVARHGRDVQTEALAGSIAASGRTAALLGRPKDREEHAIVAREIVRALEPICAEVRVAAAPEVRALRHVAHLWTPISARLDADVHVLDVAAALHPTPAVGGAPGRASVAWIRAHEPTPRGWYAGAVGWIDDRGDGDLAVALRCGVIARGRAHVYAGAGIVAGSDPATEWDETELKLRAFLRALGGADDRRRAHL